MAKWEFVEWLLFWILDTSSFDFEWDRGNQTKNLNKHGISTAQVEGVFRSGLALPLGIQLVPVVSEQRLGIVGPSLNGKLLHIAFTLRGSKVRVISARIAHRKERKQYEEILRQITKSL